MNLSQHKYQLKLLKCKTLILTTNKIPQKALYEKGQLKYKQTLFKYAKKVLVKGKNNLQFLYNTPCIIKYKAK